MLLRNGKIDKITRSPSDGWSAILIVKIVLLLILLMVLVAQMITELLTQSPSPMDGFYFGVIVISNIFTITLEKVLYLVDPSVSSPDFATISFDFILLIKMCVFKKINKTYCFQQ